MYFQIMLPLKFKLRYAQTILDILFASLTYLIFVKFLDARLIYHVQQPVFFFGWRFFMPYCAYPGGIADYAGSFFCQFYYYPGIGAGIITATLLLSRITAAWLVALCQTTSPVGMEKCSGQARLWLLSYVPAILLLAMHCNFNHPLSISLSLITALYAAIVYCSLQNKQWGIRLSVFAVLAAFSYWSIGAPMIIYALLCILFEIIYHRRIIIAIGYALLTLAIPFSTGAFLLVSAMPQIWLHQLPVAFTYQPEWLPFCFIGYLLILIPLCFLFSHLANAQRTISAKDGDPPPRLFTGWMAFALSTVGVLCLSIFLVWTTNNHALKTSIRIKYYAQKRCWSSVLDIAYHDKAVASMNTFDVYRALYHEGRLLNDLFEFQKKRLLYEDPLLPKYLNSYSLMQVSETFFDLGHLNASLHWAYESLMKTYSLDALKKIALIGIITNHKTDALRCLGLLEKSPVSRQWAKRYSLLANSDSLAMLDSQIVSMRSLMPDTDFLMSENPLADLMRIAQQKPLNKMVFEYLAANDLLTYNVDDLIQILPKVNALGYQTLPALYEESLLLYMNAMQKQIDLGALSISARTKARYRDFDLVASSCNGKDKCIAEKMPTDLRNTFWFYWITTRNSGQ